MSHLDRMDELGRDLSYHPVENPNPRTLSIEQIGHYNREGYISPVDVFNRETVLENRRAFDQLLADFQRAGQDSYSINGYHRYFRAIYDLVTHSAIKPFITDLLGERFVGWGSHFFCKMPGDGKTVSWHQDAPYWPLSPSKTVTVWLAIDDSDHENGCMQVLPGSHLKGSTEYENSRPEENNVLNLTAKNADNYGDPVDIELKAGQISLHSDLLLHRSMANNSARRRCGLTMRFASMDVKAHWDWNRNSIWVSGVDESGHWANHPRPEADIDISELIDARKKEESERLAKASA